MNVNERMQFDNERENYQAGHRKDAEVMLEWAFRVIDAQDKENEMLTEELEGHKYGE